MRLEDECLLLSDQLLLISLIRSDSKVAQVTLNVDALPRAVERHKAGQEADGHAVSVARRRAHRRVSINVSVEPEQLAVRVHLLGAVDGTDGLRVVAAENQREVTVGDRLGGGLTQVLRRERHILDVLRLLLLFRTQESALFIRRNKIISRLSDLDLLVFDVHVGPRLHGLEPGLLLKEDGRQFDSALTLTASKGIA